MAARPRGVPVLLVDDDVDVLQLLSELLVEEGYRVHTACDGRQALEVLEAAPDIDLIVLDILMPVMDGIEFLARADLRHARVFVFSECAYTERVPQHPAVVASFEKPFDIDRFLAVLGAYAAAARAASEPVALAHAG